MDESHECHRAKQYSRYAMVRVSVSIGADGSCGVRIAMKPNAACWDDLPTGHVLSLPGIAAGLPSGPEECAEIAVRALRAAYPGLF